MARDRRTALAASIQAEREATQARVPIFADRFEKAENALGRARSSATSRSGKSGTAVAPYPSRTSASATEKVIRDSFTMPSKDYKKITQLREKCLKAGLSVTKGEILRAGLHALESLSAENLRQAVQSVEKIKPGRPGRE